MLTILQIHEIEAQQKLSLGLIMDTIPALRIEETTSGTFNVIDDNDSILGYINSKINKQGDVSVSWRPNRLYAAVSTPKKLLLNVVDRSDTSIRTRTINFVQFINSIKDDFGL